MDPQPDLLQRPLDKQPQTTLKQEELADSCRLQLLLETNEREIRSLYAASVLKHHHKHQLYMELCSGFKALQDDFVYNTRLLKERDVELESLDKTMTDLQTHIYQREHCIDELKIALAERLSESSMLKAAMRETDLEHQQELQRLRHTHDNEIKDIQEKIRQLMEELESEKVEYEVKIKAAKFDLDHLRTELNSEIEILKKKQKSEIHAQKRSFEIEITDARQQVVKRDTEINALKKTLELHKADLDGQKSICSDMEKQLRKAKWEMMDTNNLTASRIAELESVIRLGDEEAASESAKFDETVTHIKQEGAHQKNMMMAQIESLKIQLSTMDTKMADMTKGIAIEQSQHQTLVLSLNEELQTKKHKLISLHEQFEALESTLREAIINHETELDVKGKDAAHLHTTISRLEADLNNRCDNIRFLKNEITEISEENRKLNAQFIQDNLNCKKTFQEQIRQQELNSNNYAKSLAEKLKAAQDEIHALKTSSQGENIPIEQLDHQTRLNLTNENSQLRAIVKSMRQEMEMLQFQLIENSKDEYMPASPPTFRNNANIESLFVKDDKICFDEEDETSERYTGNRGWAAPYSKPTPQSDQTEAHQLQKQILGLQSLLALKQKLIDELLDSQSAAHARLDSTVRKSILADTGHQAKSGLYDPYLNVDSTRRVYDESEALRRRLNSSVNELREMAREKDHLIDMSNSLRAEMRMSGKNSIQRSDRSTQTMEETLPQKTRKHIVTSVITSQKQAIQPTTATFSPPLLSNPPTHPLQHIETSPSKHHQQPLLLPSKHDTSSISKPALTHVVTVPQRKKLHVASLRSRGVRNWNDKNDTSR
ncbi:hypothetical protein BASA83_009968 [Batrachochytrium salamandrivorans]|nr:hypothetical protein BASA83_009968 [Batrachochytrium salamandrivorans]